MKEEPISWKFLAHKFSSTCHKNDHHGKFVGKIIGDLEHEMGYLTSRNYPHDSF
jgi:hypothetical protein